MSLFKFKHIKNKRSELNDVHSVYFLNEANAIVAEPLSKKFVVKKKNPLGGFKEFFGVINNPHYQGPDIPIPNLPFVDEEADVDPYHLFGLDKTLYVKKEEKTIPLFTPHNFVELVPLKFGDTVRTLDDICSAASNNRQTIFNYYEKLETRFVKSLSEVNCNTVAYLYEYLNDGEKWEVGMEYYGYVDGLWEIGSYLTVSIDTPHWDVHTSIHELGHSVSYYLIDDMFNEWFELVHTKEEMPPSEYAKTEVSEDFAESFGFYFGEVTDRDAFRQLCPVRYAYMAKLEKMEGNALVYNLNPSVELTKRFKKYDAVMYA